MKCAVTHDSPKTLTWTCSLIKNAVGEALGTNDPMLISIAWHFSLHNSQLCAVLVPRSNDSEGGGEGSEGGEIKGRGVNASVVPVCFQVSRSVATVYLWPVCVNKVFYRPTIIFTLLCILIWRIFNHMKSATVDSCCYNGRQETSPGQERMKKRTEGEERLICPRAEIDRWGERERKNL